MNLVFKNGVISAIGPDGEIYPTADDIYSRIFEGGTGEPDATALRKLGLIFSREPASPVLLLTADNPPIISCALAGKIGNTTVTAGLVGQEPVDYVISEGTWYPLPPGTTDQYFRTIKKKFPDRITIGEYLNLINSKTDLIIEDQAADRLTASSLSGLLAGAIPAGLHAVPYPYQEIGIRWLGFLARQGVGCILADEMGLGKTLQVIGTLIDEISAGRGPNLVVCPATLLENWRRELSKFAPSLKIMTHSGGGRSGFVEDIAKPDVLIVSYDTLAADISIFRAVSWNLVVLDEAQAIRNPKAKRTIRCKDLSRRAAIAVTGTPVENRLLDLWSITDFAIPGYLGTQQDFEKAHTDSEESARALEPIVSAIMLRRRIAEVADDLPPRIDVPLPLLLDDISATAYDEIRQNALRESPKAGNLAALVRLRMFCSHPWAAEKFLDIRDPIACSPKLERLIQILEEIFAAKEKALIFTSFNETANILEQAITNSFGVPTGQINGSVPVADRQPLIDTFTNHNGPSALVLNPRAAGTGLNITAANHVIHYNLEWNPAVEDQASARSHRRGQNLPVTIHRLYYAGTVEEVIAERMERKRAIAENAVVGASGTEEDLADIVEALHRSPLQEK